MAYLVSCRTHTKNNESHLAITIAVARQGICPHFTFSWPWMPPCENAWGQHCWIAKNKLKHMKSPHLTGFICKHSYFCAPVLCDFSSVRALSSWYRLLIFKKFLLFTILSKNWTEIYMTVLLYRKTCQICR